MATVKVYGLVVWRNWAKPAPNGSKQVLAVVAATSQARAAKAFDVPLSELRRMGGETGNEQSIAAAWERPGVVAYFSNNYPRERIFPPEGEDE